jgi:hypothetical protein
VILRTGESSKPSEILAPATVERKLQAIDVVDPLKKPPVVPPPNFA